MTLKGILHQLMYKDRLTVSRQVPATDAEGADDYAVEDVYADIPCKLSQYSGNPGGVQNDREYATSEDLRVCLDPEYDIRANDILTVTHEGQTFQLNAAEPFRYPTHQEISARRDGEA